MSPGLIDSALAGLREAVEPRVYGVAVAEVIDNIDGTGGARVQLRLPWMPGYEPWARVAAFSAGSDRGAFFIPQTGDEVLVAFNHGDVRDPYVVGSLWNGQDSPPSDAPNDAISKRIIRTPAGHEIELDDLDQSVTVTTSAGQEVRLESSKIELTTSGDSAKVTLETSGQISLTGNVGIELKAPKIMLDGTTVELKASASATVDGGGACTVKGGVVKIN
jgi:uncharacterized protein involved in type VI secretion and phage assembly